MMSKIQRFRHALECGGIEGDDIQDAFLDAVVPGLSDVLNGKAVIMPVEATDDMHAVFVGAIENGFHFDDAYAAMLRTTTYQKERT
jgi:hypothetical protein